MSSLSIQINVSTYGGYGSLSGDQQTVRRYITQCNNSGGTILVDGEPVSLSEAESAFSGVLNDDVSGDVRILELSSGTAIPGLITLQIVAE